MTTTFDDYEAIAETTTAAAGVAAKIVEEEEDEEEEKVVVDDDDDDDEKILYPCYCTLACTGTQKTYQAIFVRHDDDDDDDDENQNQQQDNQQQFYCVCEACANHCGHADYIDENGEEIIYLGMANAYCDCNDLLRGKCKILEESQKKVREWNFPIGKIQCTPIIKMTTTTTTATAATGDEEQQYVMDAYRIPELYQNEESCRYLVEQASKLVRQSKETFWLSNNDNNSNDKQSSWCSLEKMAWRIYEQNKLLYNLEDNGEGGGGAEWWVQVKKNPRTTTTTTTTNMMMAASTNTYDGSEAAIDLHYDKDEELAEKYGIGSFPTLSTVTYLTQQQQQNDDKNTSTTNPTVILRRTYEQTDDEIIPDMLVSHPILGKHLVFDGRLLHGAPNHIELIKSYTPQKSAATTTSSSSFFSSNKEEEEEETEEQEEKRSQHSSPNSDNDDNSKNLRVTLLVNIWANRKPAGVNPLPDRIRQYLNSQQQQSSNDGTIMEEGIIITAAAEESSSSSLSNFQKQEIETITIKDDEGKKGEEEERDRIELPFVCKGTTWASEDDDDESDSGGLVVVTFPPPPHTDDTISVKFGPGLQAYLDQPCLAEEDRRHRLLPPPPPDHYDDRIGNMGYEDAYI